MDLLLDYDCSVGSIRVCVCIECGSAVGTLASSGTAQYCAMATSTYGEPNKLFLLQPTMRVQLYTCSYSIGMQYAQYSLPCAVNSPVRINCRKSSRTKAFMQLAHSHCRLSFDTLVNVCSRLDFKYARSGKNGTKYAR